MANSSIFIEVSKEFYPKTETKNKKSTITLLARSTAPIDLDTLSPQDLQTLNSAAVIAGEAARTCYSPSLQTPHDYLRKSEKYKAKTDEIIQSTKEAGHLTTRQHVYYTFALEGVSRHAINFLHSQPHYNSEEVSQRYVNFKESSPIIPDLGSEELNQQAKEIGKKLIRNYETLYHLLIPTAKAEIIKRFPGRNNAKWEKQNDDEAKKKSQEIARYLLPLGTPTNLYFSISELTLIRLNHLKNTFPAQPEMGNLIDAMIDIVATVDPSIISEVGTPIDPIGLYKNRHSRPDRESIKINTYTTISQHKSEFDELIFGKDIHIDPLDKNIGEKIARSVRLTLNLDKSQISDSEAIALLLDPAKNKLLTSVYGEIVMDHLSQCLNQVNISALVSLSHTANYQLQRHRGLDHTTPLILDIPDLEKDIIVPNLLLENTDALAFYLSTLNTHINSLHELSDQGVSLENLQYLFPNSVRIRKSISGPLSYFFHLIKSRTCLTAQEEIYSVAVSLAEQISQSCPELAPYFIKPAPCGVRSLGGIRPQCPEGKRFCGVRVWDLNIDQYPKRTI